MRRLSIAAIGLLAPLGACTNQGPALSWTPIARPAPENATPQGIAYICEGRKEVSVVYAKNRASVTFGDKTWRTEYQATGDGFRYADSTIEWTGRDDLAGLREVGSSRPLAFNCRPTRRTT
jgi:membrane-bound inhibitor of C-type lysozyme